MYKNLLGEIAKAGLNNKDIARLLNLSINDFMQKLSGQKDFLLNECLKIKSVLAGNKLGLEYLFDEAKGLK